MNTPLFPMAGQRFEVCYGGLVAENAYAEDGRSLTYVITGGALAGNTATVCFEWRRLQGGAFAIAWQEADGATVVHVDDFEAGRSLAFFHHCRPAISSSRRASAFPGWWPGLRRMSDGSPTGGQDDARDRLDRRHLCRCRGNLCFQEVAKLFSTTETRRKAVMRAFACERLRRRKAYDLECRGRSLR